MESAKIIDRELGGGWSDTISQSTTSTAGYRELRTRPKTPVPSPAKGEKTYGRKRRRTQYDGYKCMLLVGSIYLSLLVTDHYRAALDDPRENFVRRQLSDKKKR